MIQSTKVQRLLVGTRLSRVFLNYENTDLTDLAITSFLLFPMLIFLQLVINLVEYATQISNH